MGTFKIKFYLESYNADGEGALLTQNVQRLSKEVAHWQSYTNLVAAFRAFQAHEQEAKEVRRRTNKAAVEACQDVRFPIRLLADSHNTVFTNGCIAAWADEEATGVPEVPLCFF